MQSSEIERCAAVLGGAGILTVIVLAGGCAQIIGIEDLPPLPVDAAPTVMPDAPALIAPDAAYQVTPDAAHPIASDAGPDGYAVGGTATGLLVPVAIELRLGGDVELLSVAQDGTFMFETRLETGASYTVVLVNPTCRAGSAMRPA